MLRLLSSGVKDTLPAVDLHTDIQLKVNVSLSCWATEAAVGRRARPALAEELTHGREARGLPVRCLAVNKQLRGLFIGFENCKAVFTVENINHKSKAFTQIEHEINGAFLKTLSVMLEWTKTRQLTQAFGSSVVSHAQTRLPSRSLRRRKRTGRRAACRHAGREVMVRRQLVCQGH